MGQEIVAKLPKLPDVIYGTYKEPSASPVDGNPGLPAADYDPNDPSTEEPRETYKEPVVKPKKYPMRECLAHNCQVSPFADYSVVLESGAGFTLTLLGAPPCG